MAFKSKMLGRDAVMRRLNQLVPEAEKQLAEAQLAAAEDLAGAIEQRAPLGQDEDAGDYRASIKAGRLADHPNKQIVGVGRSKDKNATGVFANYKWRWLEFGTAPHAQPNNPRVGYKHPGSRAQPHIFPTYRQKLPAIRKSMTAAVNKAVRKVRGK